MLHTGANYRLPSSIQKVWSSFHVARFDQVFIGAWEKHILSLKLPEALHSYTAVAFQMILDRLMKGMITARKNDLANPMPMPFLGHREKNVVHYMGGFVVIRLPKWYSKDNKFPASTKAKTFCECSQGNEGRESTLLLGYL